MTGERVDLSRELSLQFKSHDPANKLTGVS